MDRYRVLRKAGDGTYGTVWRAIHRPTGALVAVKRFRAPFPSWAEAVALREVRALRTLRAVPGAAACVVSLREVVREGDTLFLVFEHMDCTLHQHLQARTIPGRGLPPTDAARWGVALFSALATVHAAGLVHRDVKPENLLLRGGAGGGRVGGELKLADFGLARRVPGLGKVAAGVPPSSSPADAAAAPLADGASEAAVAAADAADAAGPLTAYVSTRWYRSPEVLLRCGGSGVTSASSAGAKPPPPPIGPPSDVWAAALVLAEMLGGRPLFPGASEGDQLSRLAAGLGPPSGAGWGPQARAAAAAAGLPLAALGEEEAAAAAAAARVGGSAEAGRARAVQWLAGALPRGTPRPALDFLAACLAWDPAARPSAAAALAHPFLAGGGVGGGGKAAAPVVAAVAAVPAAAVPTAADPYWLVRWSPSKPVVAVEAAAVAHAGVTATLRVGGGGGVRAAAPGPPPPPPVPSSSSSTCADLAAAAALLAEAVAVVGAAAPPEGLALAAAVEQVRAQRRAAAKAAKAAAGRSGGAAWAAAAAAAAAPAGVSV